MPVEHCFKTIKQKLKQKQKKCLLKYLQTFKKSRMDSLTYNPNGSLKLTPF